MNEGGCRRRADGTFYLEGIEVAIQVYLGVEDGRLTEEVHCILI